MTIVKLMLITTLLIVGLSGCVSTRLVGNAPYTAASTMPPWLDAHFQIANSTVPDHASIFWLDKEAVKFANKNAQQRLANPYYHYMLARQAMHKGELEDSIVKFKRAISINDRPHQFYAGLAEAYARQNHYEKSRFYLRQAKRKAEFDDEIQRYESKLTVLANVQAGH